MEPIALKQAIREHASQLGFEACRFAPAVRPPHADAFLDWLQEGQAGEMGWLAKNAARRTDPQLVLPGARTVVMVAKSYGHPPAAPVSGAPAPYQIAQYAWGDDYHEVLTPRLRALEEILAAHGGRQRSYVDT
ncbi:MAG: DUF1730 domain-containing protein, partial [Chthoniobacterales bacterium]|nr:DUF1730 domain-containing protein [Chthoniobacterales bacterium]